MPDELKRDPIGWVSLSEINMFELQTFCGFGFQLKNSSSGHVIISDYSIFAIKFSALCTVSFVCVRVGLFMKTKALSHYEYRLEAGEASRLYLHLKICVCP